MSLSNAAVQRRSSAARRPARPAQPLAAQLSTLMAHELRTPLATFAVTLAVLRETDDLQADDMRHLLGRLDASTRWMTMVLDSLLALAVLEQSEPDEPWRPVPVSQVVLPALDVMLPLLEQRRQPVRTLSMDLDMWVAADATLLGQALVNLLTNASGYSAPGEPIELSLEADADRVVIRVTDHGPGIADEERERIFELHGRGRAGERRPRGLGLGLALARRIVEHFDGRLGVDSVVGHGASFWIELPRATPSLLPPSEDWS